MDPRSLYDSGIPERSDQQAGVPRALAARPDRPNEVDFANIVEEIWSVRRSRLRAVESHLRLSLERLAKLASAPDPHAASRRRGNMGNWRADRRTAIGPSMPGRIDPTGTGVSPSR